VLAITVLEELAAEIADACRAAEQVPLRCSRGEPVDAAVAELERRLGIIRAKLSHDSALAEAAARPLRDLADRIRTATTRLEGMKVATGMELESLTQRSRVQRAYARGPT
jgi:hypothetical protein